MPPKRSGYSKRKRSKSNPKSSGDVSEKQSETNMDSERIQNEASGETSNENGASAENESVLNEDESIAKLYKKVIQEIMGLNDKKVVVAQLQDEMKKLMKAPGSKSKVKGDQKMDMSKPSNLCVYLSVHGTCHTGLVKQAIGNYFKDKKLNTIFTRRLRIVSLGGGPGCDCVGFCSALQDTGNERVTKVKFRTVEIKEWKPVFKAILRIARETDFGNLSKLQKNAKVSRNFIAAELNKDDVFKDESLSSAIREADFILMVQLGSFSSNYGDKNLIKNVVDTMKAGSKFIFIYKEDNDFFRNISSVFSIFENYEEYKVSPNPSTRGKFSTVSDGALIRVFQKK